jgi:hypothetical protein
MKRIDKIVGIDGTAQGRMNNNDSHLIHHRACNEEDERVDHRPREDRIVDQLDVARGMAGQPKPITDRVEHEDQKHQHVGGDQDQAPGLPGR